MNKEKRTHRKYKTYELKTENGIEREETKYKRQT